MHRMFLKSYECNICIIDDVEGIVKWGEREFYTTLFGYESKIGIESGKISRVKLLNDVREKYRMKLKRVLVL